MSYHRGVHATWLFRRLAVVGALGAVTVLTLSDSILGPLRRTAARGLAGVRGVESVTGVDMVSRSDLPAAPDIIGHVVLWSVVGLLTWGVARTWAVRLGLLVGLFALSALLEVGQQYLSWSRAAELSDLAANGVGLVGGFAVAAVLQALRWPRLPAGAHRGGGDHRG